MFLEGRAISEFGAFLGALPLLSLAPRGDGHPVLVLPGLVASDISTRPLRSFLKNRGYAVSGWRQGRNYGLRDGVQDGMMNSRDATLAAVAAKSEKESAYHLRHSSEWMVRLGDGTDESHRRAQTAVDDLWAFTGEMFAVDDSERGLIDAGIAVDPETLRASC